MKERGISLVALVPKADYLPEIENLSINIPPINMGRFWMNLLHDLQTLFSLRNLMKKIKLQVVFNYMIKPVVHGNMGAWFRNEFEAFLLWPSS